MRKLFVFLFFVFLCEVAPAQEAEKLTNQSVVDMVEMGFGEEIILSKIRTAPHDFDTSLSALKALKEKGVPAKVIAEMIGTDDALKKEEEMRKGIYARVGEEELKILPSVFSGSKTRVLAAGLTYGIASGKVKSIINNAESRNVIKDRLPAFYFYFAPSSGQELSAQGGTDWWFKTATSPNEFVLVKLKSNKNKNVRELLTGKVNVYSGSTLGIDPKDAIPFRIEPVSDLEYKVVPELPFEPGEYCFFYQGTIPQGGVTNQSIFDFSIR